MWPKRKILFLVPHGTEDWQGLLSLLEALHNDVIVRETSVEVPADLTGLTFSGVERDLEDLSDGGPTEILYWADISLEDGYRQWGLSQGLTQMELSEFLHKYWNEEIILPVDSNFLFEGEPLLWRLLEAADFEPSLLWRDREGQWTARIGRGLHWVISRKWLEACCDSNSLGRQPERVLTESYWFVHDDQVHFYKDPESYSYIGSLDQRFDRTEEEAVYNTVLLALQLGVPWSNIRNVLRPIFKSPRDDIIDQETSLRWNVDDTQRHAWPSGRELSPEEFEHLEDWGIR